MNIKDASYYNKIANQVYKNKFIKLKNDLIKSIEDRAKQGYTYVTKNCDIWPSDMLSTFKDELLQKDFMVRTYTDCYGFLKIHIEW